jgi:tetratricopeptide (TPR) repeat protein
VAGEGDALGSAETAGDAPALRGGASSAAAAPAPRGGAAAPARGLLIVIALLVAKRIAYHLIYIVRDPFALATFSDGQVYELAARDILAHPPFGSQPFYLQGLYAYVLALPMTIAPQVVMGLVLQLVLAAGALWLFHRTARAQLGALAGALSTIVLLAYPELAFYENKYLSVSFGITCNVFALWAACKALRDGRPRTLLLAGFAGGISTLGRPNMLLALPFTLAALLIAARARKQTAPRVLLAFAAGAALALAPMALRNLAVIGSPDVFPSHAGAIPFYIGNNPHANGRWNTAGGLVTGQVGLERAELAQQLGVHADTPAELDRAIGDVLIHRAFEFIREQPGAWLGLEVTKLWYTIGNHRFVRDYDVHGENELIGAVHQFGLPFGVLLGLGVLGLFVLLRRGLRQRAERARCIGVWLVLVGQLLAVLAANLLVFASAQNREPLCIPLAFVSGPALLAIWTRVRPAFADKTWEASALALALAGALLMQSFWPRLSGGDQPTSVHYYNMAAVEEVIGRLDDAAVHYARAIQRNPREPVFRLSLARTLRQLGRTREADAVLDQLVAMRDLPPMLRKAAEQERRLLHAPTAVRQP